MPACQLVKLQDSKGILTNGMYGFRCISLATGIWMAHDKGNIRCLVIAVESI